MLLRFLKTDAAEGVFFARELESIRSKTYDILYPEFRARRFIPVTNEAGPGAESITYYQFRVAGMAKLLKGGYSAALARADVAGEKFTASVEAIGNSYGWNIDELAAAFMAKRPLPMMKSNAARQVHEQKVDEILATGDTETGLIGFLNHPNVPRADVANPGGGTTWAVKTADQILVDLNAMVSTMVALTKGVETPDTLLLPLSQYTLIAQLKLPNLPITLLKFFLDTNPFIKNVDHWWRLTGAGSGATDRAMVYRRDPGKVEADIPKEFEQRPVQEEGLEFLVPCHSRIGGVKFYYPLSAAYYDGI